MLPLLRTSYQEKAMTNKIPVTQSGVINKPWAVAKDSRVELSTGQTMFIPQRYLTDFASIPKILRVFFNHIGEYRDAFIVHDFLYNYRGFHPHDTMAIYPASRNFADDELAYQMRKYGAKEWRVKLYYIAVRLFGWINYGKI